MSKMNQEFANFARARDNFINELIRLFKIREAVVLTQMVIDKLIK